MKSRRKIQEVAPELAPAAQVTPMISADARARLGDLLLSSQALSPDQLAGALNLQMASGRQ